MRRKINYNFPVLTPYSNLLQDRNTRNLEKIDGRWKGRGRRRGRGRGRRKGRRRRKGREKGRGREDRGMKGKGQERSVKGE